MLKPFLIMMRNNLVCIFAIIREYTHPRRRFEPLGKSRKQCVLVLDGLPLGTAQLKCTCRNTVQELLCRSPRTTTGLDNRKYDRMTRSLDNVNKA